MENNGFKQTEPLTPQARCRGEAHAERVRIALGQFGAELPGSEADLKSALTDLGYPNASVYATGNDLAFSFIVAGAGPCISGTLGDSVRLLPHGVYLEGGCSEPRGGH
ncbi:hypothetical protein [Sporichthya polymorpha]|uniref:hypothetical protein n=1 Tax=Sporichthya polymorpha TaxID=35751 RepID=UPI0012EC4792|nr:hypothetical protein [Sporichthya polymorpha]